MATITTMSRPQRWNEPFGPDMTDADVAMLRKRPEISAINAERFPGHAPLEGILRNDTRIVRYKTGEIVVREGDYGNSAFLVLSGTLRVVLSPELPREMLGRKITHKKNPLQALAQLWTNRRLPEVRDTRRYTLEGLRQGRDAASSHVCLQDVPAVLDAHQTAKLGESALFGELAALGRVPRTASVFAETDAVLLEIRWQGLRELRNYDEGWRRMIDARYRENALKRHLQESSLFNRLDNEALQQVADNVLFETYGSFDWNVSFKKLRSQPSQTGTAQEPLIARQGDYPDGLLMIRSGFVRVSVEYGHGERTLTYLGKGDSFGLEELYTAWREKRQVPLEASLSGLGYVDLLRVPTHVLEQHVLPHLQPPERRVQNAARRPVADDALLEWAVDERFINGTKAMVINLERCTRCDDCVRACEQTHGGNARFLRHGKTIDHWMVANACMHCVDPVCLIGCPTGAIHRSLEGGAVVINDDTCIGCGTCATSCPYDNIRMVTIHDQEGNRVLDMKNQTPIAKATKCDLCVEQLGGPACERACPHDALQRLDFHTLMQNLK